MFKQIAVIAATAAIADAIQVRPNHHNALGQIKQNKHHESPFMMVQ